MTLVHKREAEKLDPKPVSWSFIPYQHARRQLCADQRIFREARAEVSERCALKMISCLSITSETNLDIDQRKACTRQWNERFFWKCADPFANTEEEESGSSKDYVHIRIQQRNGKKSLTTIQVFGSLGKVKPEKSIPQS